MTTKMKINHYSWLILLMLALPTIGVAGNDGVRYYMSLGTSLSVGIQPDVNGLNQRTDEGYPDQLFEMIEPQFRKIRLVKLGCPGETTTTMIEGGICTYAKGSQLTEAVKFLRAHKDKVELVTIDLGVNDLLTSGCIVDTDINEVCLAEAILEVAANLTTILTALQQAANPDTPIVGMNYYNTFLASWLTGPAGQTLADQSILLAGFFNSTLGMVYSAFGYPVADVAGAFQSNNPTQVPFPPFGLVPINVIRICQWTYMCVPPPAGPNIHANPEGYGIIADAFLLALP
jgi:lysophospholipase L1-like esterase